MPCRDGIIDISDTTCNLPQEKSFKIIEKADFFHLITGRIFVGQILEANAELTDIAYLAKVGGTESNKTCLSWKRSDVLAFICPEAG